MTGKRSRIIIIFKDRRSDGQIILSSNRSNMLEMRVHLYATAVGLSDCECYRGKGGTEVRMVQR